MPDVKTRPTAPCKAQFMRNHALASRSGRPCKQSGHHHNQVLHAVFNALTITPGLEVSVPNLYLQETQRKRASKSAQPATQKGMPCRSVDTGYCVSATVFGTMSVCLLIWEGQEAQISCTITRSPRLKVDTRLSVLVPRNSSKMAINDTCILASTVEFTRGCDLSRDSNA